MKLTRIIFPLLLLLIFIACAPQAGTTPLKTATSTQVMPEATATLTAIPPLAQSCPRPRPLAERVLIISFDGLRPDAIGARRG